MARRLKQLTHKIHTYVTAKFPQQARFKQPIHCSTNGIVLNPALQVAFLQGEAILRLRFFQYLDEKHITNPVDQCNTWNLLVEDKRFIQQVVEKSELVSFFKFNIATNSLAQLEGKSYQTLCFTTFCILLWDIQQNDVELVEQLINGLVIHFLPTLYPKQVQLDKLSLLQSELLKLMTKAWHQRPEIKESFHVSEDKVIFSLTGKIPKCSTVTLIKLEGKRLKTTRLAAYQQLILRLEKEEGSVPVPSVNVPKKQDKMRPLLS